MARVHSDFTPLKLLPSSMVWMHVCPSNGCAGSMCSTRVYPVAWSLQNHLLKICFISISSPWHRIIQNSFTLNESRWSTEITALCTVINLVILRQSSSGQSLSMQVIKFFDLFSFEVIFMFSVQITNSFLWFPLFLVKGSCCRPPKITSQVLPFLH